MAQMTPVRRRPSSMLQSLQQEVNDLFGDFFGGWDEQTEGLTRMWAPRMDLTEADNEYRIQMDLPGISKDEVEISAEDRRLMIQGHRKEEKKEEGERFLRVERAQGHFFRSLPLPDAALLDKAKATFQDGVLTIRVPKSETKKTKRISIK